MEHSATFWKTKGKNKTEAVKLGKNRLLKNVII